MSEWMPVSGMSGHVFIVPPSGLGLLIWTWSLVLQVEKEKYKMTFLKVSEECMRS